MADYSCQDCTRCSQSGFTSLLRFILAVCTLGASELALGFIDFFGRKCPGCGHPMSTHTLARYLYKPPQQVQQVQQHYAPQPYYQQSYRSQAYGCSHPQHRVQYWPNGATQCHDCGGSWDAWGNPY